MTAEPKRLITYAEALRIEKETYERLIHELEQAAQWHNADDVTVELSKLRYEHELTQAALANTVWREEGEYSETTKTAAETLLELAAKDKRIAELEADNARKEAALRDMVGLFTALNEFVEAHSEKASEPLLKYLDNAKKALSE